MHATTKRSRQIFYIFSENLQETEPSIIEKLGLSLCNFRVIVETISAELPDLLGLGPNGHVLLGFEYQIFRVVMETISTELLKPTGFGT